jgi:hypothetical protein
MATRSKTRKVRRWSKRVTETSDAMTLDPGVFKKPPRELAKSVKRSAERSRRRKSEPYRSAMSMLTFYENRAGKNLSARDRARLESAKEVLRELFHRPPRRKRTSASGAAVQRPARKASGRVRERKAAAKRTRRARSTPNSPGKTTAAKGRSGRKRVS